jgi:ABC-2 type transport system permease protein
VNHALVQKLIAKDWYFNRWPLAGYVLTGLAALVPLAIGGSGGFYLGSILLITVLISIGIHLTMITVVHERSEHTLAFIMTLPISPIEYTTAKIIANVAIFGLAWGTLLVATVAVIAGRGALPDGLIPFAIVILAQLFSGYCLILGVALVSESLGWTIGAIVASNLLVQGVMYWVSNAPGIQEDLARDVIVWRQPISGLLCGEFAAIALILGATYLLQSRKTDFV